MGYTPSLNFSPRRVLPDMAPPDTRARLQRWAHADLSALVESQKKYFFGSIATRDCELRASRQGGPAGAGGRRG